MTFKLLTEHQLKLLSLKGGCTGSSESTLVKMPHCWKSHSTADPESFSEGSNFDYVFLFDNRREDPNTTISGPSSTR